MTNIALNIISKFGGHDVVSHIVGIDRSNVHRWTYPKDKGGTGGIIPARHQPVLLAKAQEMGIDLKPSDFFDLSSTAITGDNNDSPQQNHVEQGA